MNDKSQVASKSIMNRSGTVAKVSDEGTAHMLIQRPYILKNSLLTGRISPGDHHNKMLNFGALRSARITSIPLMVA